MGEDPKERIYGKTEEHYLPLQSMLTMSYEYKVAQDLNDALKKDLLHDLINSYLFKSRKAVVIKRKVKNRFNQEIELEEMRLEDDLDKMARGISELFGDLGKAGFYLEADIN